MIRPIRRCLVLGSGTMGAALAAHLVNAGFEVGLLDIVPAGSAEGRPGDRDAVARAGLRRAREAKPAAFFVADWADRVRTGNLEDHLGWAAEADWVIEAVVEDLAIKQALFSRLEAVRGANTIVTTNTSGIPVAEIARGRGAEFRRHFLGTHFFNPPRYLPLLELIPLAETEPEIVSLLETTGDRSLGKTVVRAKDTPNFIANRLGSVSGAFLLHFALANGYSVEEVDAVTGPLLGRPKTATFRLLDLVGLDTAGLVRSHLARALPDDEAAPYLNSPAAAKLTDEMISRGWLGNKTGVGFYKPVKVDGEVEYWPLDLADLEHRPPRKPDWPELRQAKAIEDLVGRIGFLLEHPGRASDMVRALIYHGFAYASRRIPEIADDPHPIDQAVRAGFLHEMGPFELWERLGVAAAVEAMAVHGQPPAGWVTEMLSAGRTSFYDGNGGPPTAVYVPAAKRLRPLQPSEAAGGGALARGAAPPLERNDGASLLDLGDGVACLEIHSKGNTLDDDVLGLLHRALERLETEFAGLILAGAGDDFSLGANLFLAAMAAQSEQWDQLDKGVRALQDLGRRLRRSPRPVVAAIAGRALGGGVELAMSAPRVVAAAESYIGLVELGAGVIPAGGGCKELLRRVVNPAMRTENAGVLPFLQRVVETIGQAKVATSAEEARALGFLAPTDRVVMNRSRLREEAKREALYMAEAYRPPADEKIYAAGRDALAAVRLAIFSAREARQITEYEAHLGNTLARVLCGGEISRPTWVDEQYILDLEREAFLSLCGEKKTQERMWHLLQNRKPLRN